MESIVGCSSPLVSPESKGRFSTPSARTRRAVQAHGDAVVQVHPIRLLAHDTTARRYDASLVRRDFGEDHALDGAKFALARLGEELARRLLCHALDELIRVQVIVPERFRQRRPDGGLSGPHDTD